MCILIVSVIYTVDYTVLYMRCGGIITWTVHVVLSLNFSSGDTIKVPANRSVQREDMVSCRTDPPPHIIISSKYLRKVSKPNPTFYIVSLRNIHLQPQILTKKRTPFSDRFWRYQNYRSRQIYDYFLVLDFEATCMKDKKIPIQEIIEFPCIKINGITMDIESIFHQYVQPQVNPMLSNFCTDLTGITQEMVDGQCDFKNTLQKFDIWLKEQGLCNAKSAFVTSGDWDLQVLLPTQCYNENISVPSYLTSWINIKQAFADATGHFPHGILHMMRLLNLKHTGRLHSGIDTTKMKMYNTPVQKRTTDH
ncbi:hypothetical protein B566_EDAN015608 [Ephemera danica]|nr:hypothetical protein B566_EDAN015608 [Ephemera danica]